MKSLFCYFFIVITLSSCQKGMGGFQLSQRENLNSISKINQKLEVIAIEEPPINDENLETSNETNLEFKTTSIPENQYTLAHKYGRIKRPLPVSLQKTTFLVNEEKDKIKKRINRNPAFNYSLKMGFVLLFIAIGLSYLPVIELTLLFGIVALIFLFIGLKKLFKRRTKEKNKRIRKENNQVRKQKVKDIFQK